MSALQIRSVMAHGNGAYIVHDELAAGLSGYELRGCSPWLASVPGLPQPSLRRWLSAADLIHLPADYGVVPTTFPVRRVATLHNFYTDDAHLKTATPLQRLYYTQVLRRSVPAAIRAADRLVVVSSFLADCVRAAGMGGRTPVDVIYNGIDVARFCPQAQIVDRPLRVLFVGNPTRRKGFHLLQAVAAALPPGVELAFTGGLRRVRHMAGDALVPLGHVPYARMHHAYQDADLLLFPTYREGFGLCVAEAMACGLPVVSTQCSAIPEVLDDGRGGFLCAPGDVDGMVVRVRTLLADAALRRDMGAWNREKAVRCFDRARMLRDYAQLFAGIAH